MLTFPSIVKLTVTGLRISALDTVAFLDNCADLIPYAGSGRRIRIKDAAGKYLDGVIGAKGTGESLGADIFSGFDFTSGWTATGSTINDADTFTTAAAGGVRKTPGITAGSLTKFTFTRSTTASACNMVDSSSLSLYATGSDSGYKTRATNYLGDVYLRNSDGGITDVSALSMQQVLTPSTSGLLIRNLAGAQSFQSQESGFAHNAASYAVEVFDMMRVV